MTLRFDTGVDSVTFAAVCIDSVTLLPSAGVESVALTLVLMLLLVLLTSLSVVPRGPEGEGLV